MRRKEPQPAQSPPRGKSLISARTTQQQQRKMQNTRSMLPRSYSSPSSQNDPDCSSPQVGQRTYVMRSFSSPEQKQLDLRRNSDSFYRPKTHGSRTELDSDLDNFEQFEECFIDIDADQDEALLAQYKNSPDSDEPRKVVTTILPGSGLHRVSIRPISSAAAHTLHGARDAMKKMQKGEPKGPNLLNFRPLVVKMPARHMLHDQEQPSLGVEELQASPQLETESAELDREMENAEQQLNKGVTMASEESDSETVSLDVKDLTPITN